jgi:hypothetical protein
LVELFGSFPPVAQAGRCRRRQNEASFKNGVLTLTLPKKLEAQKPAKKIEVDRPGLF